jgi:energy-coupling factor transporter transmembrane protein EcfT
MARWLEYEKRDTFLHNELHPLTKMIVMFTVVLLGGIWWDPRYMVILLVGAFIVIYISKVPLRWFKIIIAAMIFAIYPMMVTAIGQTNPEIFKVLDRQWASTEILTVTVPVAGKIGLTYGSLVWFLTAQLRFFVITGWVFVFIYTTSVSDLANTLMALRVPQPIVFVISITYKFIPYISRVIEHILDAQRLRGWTGGGRNPVRIAQQAVPLARPLLRRIAVMTDEVTISSQMRAFGSGMATPTREIRLRGIDWVVLAATVGGFALAVYLMIFYNVGLI